MYNYPPIGYPNTYCERAKSDALARMFSPSGDQYERAAYIKAYNDEVERLNQARARAEVADRRQWESDNVNRAARGDPCRYFPYRGGW